jgi:LCP family protein required for cell wall assembly
MLAAIGILFGIAVWAYTPEEPFSILVLGLDFADWGDDAGESDAMVLCLVDPQRTQMVHLPRDWKACLPDVGPRKINYAHVAGGPLYAVEQVQLQTGVAVSHWVSVDMEAFERIIDMLGGVEVTVAETTKYTIDGDTVELAAGTHQLNGEHALRFVRHRGGGRASLRSARHEAMIEAVIRRLASVQTMGKLPALVTEVSKCVHTNLSAGDIASVVRCGLQCWPDRLTSNALPTSGMQVLNDWYELSPDATAIDGTFSAFRDAQVEAGDLGLSRPWLVTGQAGPWRSDSASVRVGQVRVRADQNVMAVPVIGWVGNGARARCQRRVARPSQQAFPVSLPIACYLIGPPGTESAEVTVEGWTDQGLLLSSQAVRVEAGHWCTTTASLHPRDWGGVAGARPSKGTIVDVTVTSQAWRPQWLIVRLDLSSLGGANELSDLPRIVLPLVEPRDEAAMDEALSLACWAASCSDLANIATTVISQSRDASLRQRGTLARGLARLSMGDRAGAVSDWQHLVDDDTATDGVRIDAAREMIRAGLSTGQVEATAAAIDYCKSVDAGTSTACGEAREAIAWGTLWEGQVAEAWTMLSQAPGLFADDHERALAFARVDGTFSALTKTPELARLASAMMTPNASGALGLYLQAVSQSDDPELAPALATISALNDADSAGMFGAKGQVLRLELLVSRTPGYSTVVFETMNAAGGFAEQWPREAATMLQTGASSLLGQPSAAADAATMLARAARLADKAGDPVQAAQCLAARATAEAMAGNETAARRLVVRALGKAPANARREIAVAVSRTHHALGMDSLAIQCLSSVAVRDPENDAVGAVAAWLGHSYLLAAGETDRAAAWDDRWANAMGGE